MSNLTPLATYNLALQPFNPVPAIEEDFPITIRISLAALDPEAADDKDEPSTLRILKKSNSFLDDDEFYEDEAEEVDDDEEDELDEETPKKKGSKKVEEEDDEEDDDDDEDEDDEEDDDISEYVVCTLSPKHQYQQTLDLTITPDEEVYFVVTGSYPIHLTGNYIEHPADEEDEEDDEDYDDEYDLTPDEDEIIYGTPLDDEDEEESEEEEEETPKIEEVVEEIVEEKTKKRAAEEPASKKSKKAKKAEDKKSVQFTKELEQGPTGSTLVEKKETATKKFPTKTLLGGVVTEDRKVGSGPTAKSGNKVGIRYIGKLKNGKVFDKNTSGKPFSFKLGKGECIKGFDLGVTGMSVGGERRVVIPPKMGYGSQALPGIPANSELTFDIKLVSLK
ncbi:FPR3 FK506-binding protein 3 [Candida maltosa Xu316]|uniref:FK506-binding protein n=1 Tax=Candida maltosa (strain Xu316) TaxID=1245528 RepID=M3IJZ6_CANMX|nr:FK506-binding protein 3 [Candida maltosa Xu316]